MVADWARERLRSGGSFMAFPKHAKYVVIGAGIHGLSSAWHLAENLRKSGKGSGRDILVLDKTGIAAGASGIACGVIRNNYFQPAMRRLMQHSVSVWEGDPQAFSYHPVGYMQISPEVMHKDVASIYGLAKKAEHEDVRIMTGVAVTGFKRDNSGAVTTVVTDQGSIDCDSVIVGVGPWVKHIWDMLELPKSIDIKGRDGKTHKDVPMWVYWSLQEGTLGVDPKLQRTNDGKMPPVIHVDTDAPLLSDVDGSVITEKLWGIYYKPDFNFGGVQGGAMPYKIQTPVDEVAVDPYGPDSPDFIVGDEFAHMWVSALAFCQKRFHGQMPKYKKEPSGGIGCFTADSFPVFDRFCENAYFIADSNHGYKMIGVGKLVADDITGNESDLLRPFRFSRFAEGKLHPVSNSPFPWS